jgi:pilus assembly protein CpaB
VKWSVIGLVFVGLLAAVAAAVLVAAIRAGGLKNITQRTDLLAEVEALVAAKDIPAMKVIDAGSVLTKKIPRKDLPQDPMTTPVQAIGQMLTVPVKRGQILSRRNLVPEGTGKELAVKAIESGMRAVSISLMDYAALQGLLYPGSLVDVMASFRGTAGSGARRDAFSLTLLQGIQVLAVEDQTVVSSVKEEGSKGGKVTRTGSKKFLVTLKVGPEEAQALQLAMQYGTLSLSLRNPFDKTPVARPRMQLRDLGLFGFQVAMAETEEEKDKDEADGGTGSQAPQEPSENPGPGTPSTQPSAQLPTEPAPSPLKLIEPLLEPAPLAPGEVGAYPQETWKMKIIRGTITSEVSFPSPDSAEDSAVPERSMRRVTP